jgi:hypothetical protein
MARFLSMPKRENILKLAKVKPEKREGIAVGFP